MTRDDDVTVLAICIGGLIYVVAVFLLSGAAGT